MQGEERRRNLGPCCACGGQGVTVRNVICLPFRAPVEGTGWGCVVCGLPADGAVAVVCDGCLASGAEVREVCLGFPFARRRVGRASVVEPFDHDLAEHREDC